jgi:hypothetical protein
LAFVAYCTRAPRSPRNALGDYALVSLAMLLLSERSWKQHYVTLILPVAFVLLHAVDPATAPSAKKRSFALLGAAVLLTGFTGEGLLGERWSDLAEAFGAWCVAALALLVATGFALRDEDQR